MKSWELMEFHYTIKEVFGSFDILNDIESEDLPAVYQFAKVVCNYTKMVRILKEEELI
jgi:hypothetical protein